MSTQMKTVNVDLDGVVYPWHEMIALFIADLMGKNFDELYEWDYGNELPYRPPTGWSFAEKWGVTSAELQSAFRLGVERDFIWSKGRPIDGAVSNLWKLDEAGYYIRIVTTRLVHTNMHAKVQQTTAAWLDEWNVPYHELVYQGKYSSKGSFLADYAIDDKPENVEAYANAGVDAYLLDRPWNQNSKLMSVKDWDEFGFILTEKAEDYLDAYQLAAWGEDIIQPVQSGSSDTQDSK